MPTIYEAQHGDDLFTIAEAFGFKDWRTIYSDPANADLRKRRQKPGLLYPGDKVVIPDKQPRSEGAETGRRHTFYTHEMARLLCVRLLDGFGKPYANTAYRLELDGHLAVEDQTDATGMLSVDIPVTAGRGRISVQDAAWEIGIGELNPMAHVDDDGVSGAQGRLRNLGYDPGPIDGVLGPLTRRALWRFQHREGISETAELDAATRQHLITVHGC